MTLSTEMGAAAKNEASVNEDLRAQMVAWMKPLDEFAEQITKQVIKPNMKAALVDTKKDKDSDLFVWLPDRQLGVRYSEGSSDPEKCRIYLEYAILGAMDWNWPRTIVQEPVYPFRNFYTRFAIEKISNSVAEDFPEHATKITELKERAMAQYPYTPLLVRAARVVWGTLSHLSV
jgi:hypothetical protein